MAQRGKQHAKKVLSILRPLWDSVGAQALDLTA